MRYRADITAGAVKLPEGRVIAGLLLRGATNKEWPNAIYDDHVLQTRTIYGRYTDVEGFNRN